MHMAISLSIYLYQTLLLASAIMSRHGDNIRFSLQKLDQIKVHLQENIDIRKTRNFLQVGGKNRLFICKGIPRFSKHVKQAKSREQLNAVREDNQLGAAYLAYLN